MELSKISQVVDHIPHPVQSTLNVSAPTAGGLWLMNMVPDVLAIVGGLWGLVQLVNFFATGQHKRWFNKD